MRHLEPYDNNKLKELEAFCKMYLVDLIDIGSIIQVETTGTHNVFTFHFFNRDQPLWRNIKDIFIPFLQMLSKEYKIYSNIVLKLNSVSYYDRHSYSSILNGDYYNDYNTYLDDDSRVMRILIDIKCR